MTEFTQIESARLRLRHFQDSDVTLFMGYRNDPLVAKYQSWEGISELEARDLYSRTEGDPTRCAWTGISGCD